MEHACRAQAVPLDEAWHGEMENEERASGQAFYSEGTGERHWEWLPTDPTKDRGLTWERYMAECERVSETHGEANVSLRDCEKGFPIVFASCHILCEIIESSEIYLRAHPQYHEFMDRLKYNLGHTAPSVTRGAQRVSGFPKKPAGGYDLVVRPMKGRAEFEPFAASPRSELRPLTADEGVYLERKLKGFARSTNRLTFQGFDNAPKRAVEAREAQQRWRQKHGKNK